MLGYILTGLSVLGLEFCGVGLITVIFYLYDKKITKN